jgi:hypothetical protein
VKEWEEKYRKRNKAGERNMRKFFHTTLWDFCSVLLFSRDKDKNRGFFESARRVKPTGKTVYNTAT